ncbi:hypothetical protein [Bradyrhizobium ivorense]|uniref:hypothetical protein n=1 Tax=Bradyrhizobium ivorense TaxID=2511166 RepID=UPI001FCE44C9|nr:hypothetical protein [Bradyrhizobium ivorense]
MLFGKQRIPNRAWKRHDPLNRTIRWLQSGHRADARRAIASFRGRRARTNRSSVG